MGIANYANYNKSCVFNMGKQSQAGSRAAFLIRDLLQSFRWDDSLTGVEQYPSGQLINMQLPRGAERVVDDIFRCRQTPTVRSGGNEVPVPVRGRMGRKGSHSVIFGTVNLLKA